MNPRSKVGCGLAVLGAALLVMSVVSQIVNEVRHGVELRERQGVRSAIASIQAGSSDELRLDSKHEMNEFVRLKDGLSGAQAVTLEISYAGGVDEFLAQIRGCPDIRRLRLTQVGVSDAGMEDIATLPNCEELALYHVPITDVGVKNLVAAPKLTTLELASYHKVSVRAVLSLPHLRRLELFNTYSPDPNESIAIEIDDFELAESLSELTLLGLEVSPERVKSLRSRLPKCKIRAFARDAGRDKYEIAPIEP